MLTGKQRRYLRGLGHHLSTVVQVGKDGVTDGLKSALAAALEEHELIKIRLGEAVSIGEPSGARRGTSAEAVPRRMSASAIRHDLASTLAAAAEAELVQVLGRTLLLYRRRREEPKIRLPR